MIVPMKKISLITRTEKKEQTLKTLRKLGIIHIEVKEASSDKITFVSERIAYLENVLFLIGKGKPVPQIDLAASDVMSIAREVTELSEQRKECIAEFISLNAELDRLKGWGDIDPESISELRERGVELQIYEMSKSEYKSLPDSIKTVRIGAAKSTVKFLLMKNGSDGEEETLEAIKNFRLALPNESTGAMNEKISSLATRVEEIDKKIESHLCCTDAIKKELYRIKKELEFETYSEGMEAEKLSDDATRAVSIAYFKGYIEAEKADILKKTASDNSWGLLVEDPTPEDNVPTKLKNNRFVSLIYPIMDFLGTVPGYFEYDISGWFLSFILIFFGIIFGDGGYGLLICAVALVPIVRSLVLKKKPSPAFLLVGLFGLSTVLWGTLTCTWFGLSPDMLPSWLKSLSVPVISNVYGDKIWYPFWTGGTVGLTTAQNVQILCFTLALVQLSVAHIKGARRNSRSIKMLGDFGSVMQLLGMYYLVLSLVVNSDVFSFGLVIKGIPVGTVAILLIGVGFLLKFVFANYEGSIVKSILASLKDIVSVLLGVVNVFSDIVSYIRLWAVGLAGAAISATVNDLVGPLLGGFMFIILAIVLLVFGHGLNMILNVLSVIVHGIRLNTLEFSSHLDMSWSGHKFKPFEN